MKQTHVLTAVCAFVSVLASAHVAVAGEQGIENSQRATMLEMVASAQPAIPAEWRADRYLATPSMADAGGQGVQAQAGTEPAIPAEWRADRYLAAPSMADTGGQGVQAKANTDPMVPAEWRADHFLAMPSVADAGDHGIPMQEMSIGSC